MTKRLESKRALILGVSPNNLGLAIARRFLDEGASVAIASRDASKTQALANELGVAGFTADLANLESIDRMVADAATAMDGLDIAVNSTGWSLLKPFLETTKEDLQQMSDVQFIGPYRFFQAVLRAINDGGSIIQISSITATIMMDDHAAYMGTKAGMDHIIRCIAHEFGGAASAPIPSPPAALLTRPCRAAASICRPCASFMRGKSRCSAPAKPATSPTRRSGSPATRPIS